MFALALHLCGRPPSLVSVYMSLSSCVLSYYTNALSLSNIYVTQAFIKKTNKLDLSMRVSATFVPVTHHEVILLHRTNRMGLSELNM